MTLLLIVTSLLFSLKSSSRQRGTTTPSNLVDCWDECFDAPSLARIDEAGGARSHSFTSVFDRRCEVRSPLEGAIKSILDELDDAGEPAGFFVEYWWRDPKRIQSLEAHRDVDEEFCRKFQTPVSLGSDTRIGIQRCPNFGHVFYVCVENVVAPTLVFQEEESDDKSHHGGGGPPRHLKAVWSIPACSNRLLRFRGDCLHAVNYPPLKFLIDVVSDDDDDDSSHLLLPDSRRQRRAVLLFNTWKKPPLYPIVGESLVIGEEKFYYTPGSETKCRPKSAWTETRTVAPKESNEHKEDLVTLDIPLLGEFSRRACKEPSVILKVEGDPATTAFTSKSLVHQVKLFQEQ